MPRKFVIRTFDEIRQRLKCIYGTLRYVLWLSNSLLTPGRWFWRCSFGNCSFLCHYWSRRPCKPELHLDGAKTASRDSRSINGNHAYNQYHNLFSIAAVIILSLPYTLIHSPCFNIDYVYGMLLSAQARLIFGDRITS